MLSAVRESELQEQSNVLKRMRKRCEQESRSRRNCFWRSKPRRGMHRHRVRVDLRESDQHEALQWQGEIEAWRRKWAY